MWYHARRNTFLVSLKQNADTTVQLDAWYHAFWCASVGAGKPESMDNVGIGVWMRESLRDSRSYRDETGLYELLREEGWDLETAAIEVRAGNRVAASF